MLAGFSAQEDLPATFQLLVHRGTFFAKVWLGGRRVAIRPCVGDHVRPEVEEACRARDEHQGGRQRTQSPHHGTPRFPIPRGKGLRSDKKALATSAQAERSGDAGPVRMPPGGCTSPAAFRAIDNQEITSPVLDVVCGTWKAAPLARRPSAGRDGGAARRFTARFRLSSARSAGRAHFSGRGIIASASRRSSWQASQSCRCIPSAVGARGLAPRSLSIASAALSSHRRACSA